VFTQLLEIYVHINILTSFSEHWVDSNQKH
jgi:hypothetical protein